MDPIEIIGELNQMYKDKKFTYGVNPIEGKIDDMKKLGVMEPVRVKRQAILSASEAASILLRIDDVVSAKNLGVPGGPSDMPDDMDF